MDQPQLSPTHPLLNQEILFTRQRHEADRMGLHWDYRMVLGDKAYSWATKKEMPGPGSAIILFEQPVHDREYALSQEVHIPKGNYGSGRTTLDWVRKAKVEGEGDKLVVHTKDGDRYLLKKLDETKYGPGGPWLFKNLAPYSEGPDSTFTHDGNKYSVDDAIAQSKLSKTVKVPVSELDWALEGAKVYPERLEQANIRQPVLITDWQGKKVVIDGTHRLYKAKSQSVEVLPTRYVDVGKLEKKSMKQENKYLTKIALNAQSARNMAKSVGIIPDHTSQWKWGLRQLRDGRGEALVGKELEKAKVEKLHAMTDSSWNRVVKTQAEHPNGELAFNIKGGRAGKIYKGEGGYAPMNKATIKSLMDKKTPNQSFAHTHPDLNNLGEGLKSEIEIMRMNKNTSKELDYRLDSHNPHRISDPSGLHSNRPNNLSKQEAATRIKTKDKLTPILYNKYVKFVEKQTPQLMAGGFERYTKKTQRFSKAINDALERHKAHGTHIDVNKPSDVVTMGMHRNDRPYTIASPHIGVEALHKTTTINKLESGGDLSILKHRKVFLQRPIKNDK
jgi:hypothetical protein